jgi:hypothetical protein
MKISFQSGGNDLTFADKGKGGGIGGETSSPVNVVIVFEYDPQNGSFCFGDRKISFSVCVLTHIVSFWTATVFKCLFQFVKSPSTASLVTDS